MYFLQSRFHHTLDISEVENNLSTSIERGLSQEEAQDRLERFGPNVLEEAKRISPFKMFIDQFRSPLVLILIVAAAIAGFLGHTIDLIVILIIIIINAILGFLQEYRAEEALEALKSLTALKAQVVRDGGFIEIDATGLVPGDLILLETGEKIPADTRLAEVIDLEVDESTLTGESTPVSKHVDPILDRNIVVADMKNMVFSSSVVTRGRGRGIVVATGQDTEIGKIAEGIQSTGTKKTPLQEKMGGFGAQIGLIVIAICAVIFTTGYLRGEDTVNMFIAAVSLAVAAVPEGLPAIVTATLAIGVQRMANRKAIIRKLPAVETLGSATVICSDKTGTMTKNQMTVRKIRLLDQSIDVEESKFLVEGKETDPKSDSGLEILLRIGVLCNNSRLEPENGGVSVIGDPTEGALLIACLEAGIKLESINQEYPRLYEVPFDATKKRMITINKNIDGERTAYVKGAAEQLLDRSSKVYKNGEEVPITEEDKNNFLETNKDMANHALRVLGFAYRKLDKNEDYSDEEKIVDNLVFVGLTGMIDPPREEVKEAIRKCKRAGIKVVMITGDHKLTAVAIGRELGVLDDTNNQVITGVELEQMSDEELEPIIDRVGVFARVSPEHKSRIVQLLQQKGHIVAMTGDGVNDAPALKMAQIGVAMGVGGTDVAREASEMVLQDNNFSSIVAAVEEGRSFFDNFQKFVVYLLATNLGEVLVIFIGLMVGMPLPLIAVQILWVNLLTDGLPALALGLDPTAPDTMKRPPRPPEEGIVVRHMLIHIFIVGAVMCMGTLMLYNWANPFADKDKARTIAFTTLVFYQLFHVFNCRSLTLSLFEVGPFKNKWLVLAVLTSILLQIAVLYVAFLKTAFQTEGLNLNEWIIILLVASTVTLVVEILKRTRKWLEAKESLKIQQGVPQPA